MDMQQIRAEIVTQSRERYAPSAWPALDQQVVPGGPSVLEVQTDVFLQVALPLLTARFAADVEKAGRADVQWLADHAQNETDRARLIGAEDAWKGALRVIQGE